MAFTVQMPALGESVTEGTVTRWLKQEGDRVEVDEPLLEVSTDKVDTEIPSPAAGVLERIWSGEDETVEVGAELAVIGDGDGGGRPARSGRRRQAEQRGRRGAGRGRGRRRGRAAAPTARRSTRTRPPSRPADASSDTAPDSGASSRRAAVGRRVRAPPVTMPALGESVTEGTVTRWLKQVGDTVEVDEPLLEVSTDKVDTEIPSPVAGTLLAITVGEDETVEVGAELAVIGDPGQARQAAAARLAGRARRRPRRRREHEAPRAGGSDAASAAPSRQAPAAGRRAEQRRGHRSRSRAAGRRRRQPATARRDGEGDGEARAPYVTPLVRKLAAEHGVDLSTVSGSGVGGRIRKQDVLAAAEKAAGRAKAAAEAAAPAPRPPRRPPRRRRRAGRRPRRPRAPPEPGSTVKLPRLRQVIAQRMTESLRVSRPADHRAARSTSPGSPGCARGRRREFERARGRQADLPAVLREGHRRGAQGSTRSSTPRSTRTSKEVTYHGAEHLAIAVDTPRGLLVPVIHERRTT